MKHLPWLNHIYYNYSAGNRLRGAGFSRWAGWGDHRHPIQFSGDAVGNWDLLRFEVDLTTTSGNAGCFFWAHDLGGLYDGTNIRKKKKPINIRDNSCSEISYWVPPSLQKAKERRKQPHKKSGCRAEQAGITSSPARNKRVDKS